MRLVYNVEGVYHGRCLFRPPKLRVFFLSGSSNLIWIVANCKIESRFPILIAGFNSNYYN